ncbi:hypothetical protein HOH87_00865 [bacterium]|jgi:hypothetical protein|nr:hypothetical protein [bacterium]
MSSYRLLAPGTESVTASASANKSGFQTSASAPVWDSVGRRLLDKDVTYSVTGYPEFDLTSEWTYKDKSGPEEIWEVNVTSFFPNDPWVEKLEEQYYILDLAGDDFGYHDQDDTYVDNHGDASTTYRKKYRTRFSDNSERRDEIEGDSTAVAYQYALFDIDSTLAYDETPVLDAFADGADRWSSKTVYSHNSKKNDDWPWWGVLDDVSVEGTQYYSRQDNIQTTLIVESGEAKEVNWSLDDTSEPEEKKGKKEDYLFEGVIKIHINDTTQVRTIKGRYIIYKKSGETLEFLIDNGTITTI